MVKNLKKKSNKKLNKKEKYESVNSDSDNDHYNDNFDPKNPFGDDEIESFHNQNDKIMLDKFGKKSKKPFNYSSDEEEVLAFDDDDDDDEDDYQDQEEKFELEDDYDEEEEDENEEKLDNGDVDMASSSWGRKKSSYYSGNKIENEEDAELEEEEANLLQTKMMKQLDTNDFGLDAFKLNKNKKLLKTADELESNKIAEKILGNEDFDDEDKQDENNLEKIAKNLSKMSKKEKLDLLRQESPELFELVRDFKEKLEELEESLLPIHKLIRNGQIHHCLASEFITNKTKLYLMYCSHLSFYFALKSQRQPIDNHPIVKNILQYRNLCKQISNIDDKLQDEVEFIVSAIKSGIQLSFRKQQQDQIKSNTINKVKKSVKFRDLTSNMNRNKVIYDDENDEDEDDQVEIQQEKQAIKELNGKEEKVDEEDDTNVNRRAINYEIEKNKGLTPKRAKMYRNPRVRNRIKSRKALIKHKSIIPKVRTQDKRYAGEMTGIRTNIVRAVKIK